MFDNLDPNFGISVNFDDANIYCALIKLLGIFITSSFNDLKLLKAELACSVLYKFTLIGKEEVALYNILLIVFPYKFNIISSELEEFD